MAKSRSNTRRTKNDRQNKAPAAAPPVTRREPRSGTKLARLIALLQRPSGVTIADAVKATGWQPHTVRGAISGALRKRLGLNVVSARSEKGVRTYKIPA